MKYFITVLVLAFGLIFTVPVQAAAPPPEQTVCDGELELILGTPATVAMCWKKNPPQDNVVEYIVQGRDASSDEILWQISVMPDYCNDYICETDALTAVNLGTYLFWVTATDGTHVSGPSNTVQLTVEKIIVPPSDLKVKNVESQ